MQIMVQALEPRRLLAYVAADYFPLAPGLTWSNTGSLDAQSATRVVSTAADTLNGVAVTRFDEAIKFADGSRDTGATFYSMGKTGLGLHEIAGHFGESAVVITFKSPLLIMKTAASVGDVIDLGAVATAVTVEDPDAGLITATGTTSGTSRVLGVDELTLPDGRLVSTVKIQIDMIQSYQGKVNGITFYMKGRNTSTLWLAKGIGSVRGDGTGKLTTTVDGDSTITTTRSIFAILDSPLIPASRGVLANGILTVNGTTARDDILLASAVDKIIVATGPVFERFSKANVNAISIFASDENDRIEIGAGVRGVYVDAGPGNDQVIGGSEADTLTGGAGKDIIDGGLGNDRINGYGGHDRLIGNVGEDRIYGGNENDTIEGGSGVDRIWGGIGDDLLAGGGSNDKLDGEDGNDVLTGGTQDDLLIGGTGHDALYGGTGIDLLFGGIGDDVLQGDAGSDSMYGEAGSDVLKGLDGESDTIDGGSDSDTAESDPIDLLLNL